jgi:hypothetical protein
VYTFCKGSPYLKFRDQQCIFLDAVDVMNTATHSVWSKLCQWQAAESLMEC